ncbi:MAG: LysR substrate-binding domain-containing protein [Sulfuricurvum sp.]|nr:LysR substrate-binding domain-containing protein [Sulfuricurvum sp.]
MFTLRQVEIFVAMAQSSRVIDVAEQLAMSPSAVSMSIRELEKELGDVLFERIGKRLMLNERGRYFLEHCEGILERSQSLFEHFRADVSGGHLSIAASFTISNYLLPKWIGNFRFSNPQVKVSLKTANSTEVMAMVREGICDLGFIEGRFSEDDELSSESLMTNELVVISSDPALQNGEYFIDELAKKRWILRERGSGTREIFLTHITPIDQELNIDMEFEHNEAIIGYLLNDMQALSCLPRICISDELKERKIFEVSIKGYKFEREFRLVWRQEKKMSRVMSDFKRYVSEHKLS